MACCTGSQASQAVLTQCSYCGAALNCLYSSVAERQSCKLKVLGSIPSGGLSLTGVLRRGLPRFQLWPWNHTWFCGATTGWPCGCKAFQQRQAAGQAACAARSQLGAPCPSRTCLDKQCAVWRWAMFERRRPPRFHDPAMRPLLPRPHHMLAVASGRQALDPAASRPL